MRPVASFLFLLLTWAPVPLKAEEAPRDPALSRSAYSLLQADEELAELNLGVRVDRNGVAYLWGPVPSRPLAAKAETALRNMPGVTGVVNQCEVTPPADTFLKEVSAALKGAPSPVPALPPTSSALAPPPPPVSPPLVERQPVIVHKPAADFITTAKGPAPAEPTARLLEPEALPATAPDYRAIERLRASDRRYAGLSLELRDGRIVVSGRAADAAAAWDLARRLAPLAGSRDIVIGRISARD